MKLATLSSFALAATCIASSSAHAAYLGLGTRHHSTVNVGGTNYSVFRVYAVFDNPDDYLTAVSGSEISGPLTIQSIQTPFGIPGSNFYNPGGSSGNKAPSSPEDPNYWGTYATIGVSDATQGVPSDETGLSPGFPNFINGNQLVSSNMAWFIPGINEQGRAGSAIAYNGEFFNDFQILNGMGVQMMQLTVVAGQAARGTVAVSVVLDGGVAGGTTMVQQTFITTPGPGGLMLLGIAGLIGSRRRR